MALRPVVSAQDGPRVTVNDLVKNPRLIPRRVLRSLENQFIADTLFRDGGSAPSGVVAYTESDPLFPSGEVGIKEEFGEYPIITTVEGEQKVAVAINRGFSILISEEMRRRNSMERVNRQLIQGRNLMIKTWDKVVRDALLTNASVPTLAAIALWTNQSTARIRQDILGAKQLVADAVYSAQAENYLGFNADTMVMSTSTANAMLGNDTFNAVYRDALAVKNPQYVGTLEREILGLTALVSRTWPNDKVWIGEAKSVGFISDERALQATELYPEKRSTETWRSDTSRISAVGVDQPQAGVILTGVNV